ncbi:aminoacyl-tRNA hydrolase [Desulforhopalus sp. IMCC35007]|uniref:aminoacyl-tRNA hydrolase n=1 Tax=Desulforhopalus sp. IMCC35007 TaxID=2569543 RepID=UPI0010ADDC4F|nr:aminoacyl-tRNA hydrolase [Desulforhopalus sp. IMCC35007]TKB09025.1 aminoacyl-tRNA hydrolase [Desulforhopalus sp. IMCC35007]
MNSQDVLIVGLGNPGAEYADTRHNIGFHVVDALVEQLGDGAGAFKEKWNGLYFSTTYSGVKVHFLKPLTFMNRSGQSVSQVCTFYKIVPENIIAIHDDLDMAPGRVKLVKGGGAGGHNGIKSIVSLVGSNDFYRLKIGIGRPGQGEVHRDFPVEKYVLSSFSAEELELISSRYRQIGEGVKYLLADDIARSKGVLNSLK